MRRVLISSALYLLAYLTGVGAAMWINLSVLCLGDPKFGWGCGGFFLYYPIWVVAYLPVVLTALVVARPGRMGNAQQLRRVLLGISFFLLRGLMLALSRREARRR